MKLIDIFLAWVSGAGFSVSVFSFAVGNWIGALISLVVSVVCAIFIGPTKKDKKDV